MSVFQTFTLPLLAAIGIHITLVPNALKIARGNQAVLQALVSLP